MRPPPDGASAPPRGGDHGGIALPPNASLDAALEALTEGRASAAPVVEGGTMIGWLSVRDVMAAYRAAPDRGTRRLRSLTPATTLFEVRLGRASPLAGRELREAKFPAQTLVVAITRDGDAIFPAGTTQIAPGDILSVMTDPSSESARRAFLDEPPSAAEGSSQ